ncbi:hypothetical protein FBU31_006474 [Coemansia sp. 'formosensis']|nr:hypothetical protein FBU31_006474 [Coemansia sp. 'formosensis']
MKHIISISLVGCALSYVVQGGLLNKLLGDIHLEINACPQIELILGGHSAPNEQPVFQSTNPACPNYVPPNEIIDDWPEQGVQAILPAVPAPELDAPDLHPGGYNAKMPESVTKEPASPNSFGAWPGVGYNMANAPALPILVNNLPPLVADTAATYTGESPAPAPVSPSVPNVSPDARYNEGNPPALPILVNKLPPLVADTAVVNNGQYSALSPAKSLPSGRYNAVNTLPLPTQFAKLPPLVADTVAINAGNAPTINPEPAPPLVSVAMPEVMPAVIPTSKCVSRAPANNYQSSAPLPSGPLAAPAVPANTATARYSGDASELGPASARQPSNPVQPVVLQVPGHPNYVNTYGATMAPIAAMPTAPIAPEIPGIPMPTTFAPVDREPVAAGQFFGQHIDTTITVEALEDLPPDVLHAVRNFGSFEFTS